MLKDIAKIATRVGGLDMSKADSYDESTNLRTDLGLDSLALAELTVEIEDKYDVDVFESGNVETLGDILKKL